MKLDAKELNQVLFDKERRQPSVSFFAGNRKKSVSLELVCSLCVCFFIFCGGKFEVISLFADIVPSKSIHISQFSRWQQLKHFWYVHPFSWGNDPIWLICFKPPAHFHLPFGNQSVGATWKCWKYQGYQGNSFGDMNLVGAVCERAKVVLFLRGFPGDVFGKWYAYMKII